MYSPFLLLLVQLVFHAFHDVCTTINMAIVTFYTYLQFD